MDKEEEKIRLGQWAVWTKWGVLLPALIIIVWTLYVQCVEWSKDGSLVPSYENNGQFGDFFGGVMNPIVALLALFWLVKGVRLQQDELVATRSALQDSEKHQANQVKVAALSALLVQANETLRVLQQRLEEEEEEEEYKKIPKDYTTASILRREAQAEKINKIKERLDGLTETAKSYAADLTALAGYALPTMEE